jgi:hypothetical protein
MILRTHPERRLSLPGSRIIGTLLVWAEPAPPVEQESVGV